MGSAIASETAVALCEQGVVLLERGEAGGAIDCFERALGLTTERVPLLNNLGNAYWQLGALDRAMELYLEAALRAPDSAPVLVHLGVALTGLRRLSAADAAFQRALAISPDHPGARWNRGLLRLLRGDWLAGWEDFEWRWRVPRYAALRPDYGLPSWDATAKSSHVLAFAEQGYGDTLQFARYLSALSGHVRAVTVIVPRALARLIRQSFPNVVVLTEGDRIPRGPTHQVSLMSLAYLFKTTVDSVLGSSGYLTSDDCHRPVEWARRSAQSVRVGVVWAGSARQNDAAARAVDGRRSVRAELLLPLAQVPGVEVVSLQKDKADSDASGAADSWSRWLRADDLVDFATTAAVISDLDLVIAVDTAVAHLAGALGKPVWLMSRFDGCWRWLTDRADTPWYRSMRIYRQPAPGAWSAVVQAVARDLAAVAARATAESGSVSRAG